VAAGLGGSVMGSGGNTAAMSGGVEGHLRIHRHAGRTPKAYETGLHNPLFL